LGLIVAIVKIQLAVICLLVTTCSFAQTQWPTKPIKFIVPIAVGGVTDAIIRKASQSLSLKLGQSIVVENIVGANGNIGAEACARANADGYTFCILNTGITSVNPLLYEKQTFDPIKAFIPVANFYSLTGAIVASRNSNLKSFKDLRHMTKSETGEINFGTIGVGSYPAIFLSWLNKTWDTKIAEIPYKGGGPVSIALQAGEVQLSAAALGNFLGQVKDGRLEAIAVSSQNRTKQLPQVPTFKELGLDDFKGKLWWGVFAPAGTPNAFIGRMNAEINLLANSPQFIEYLESQAAEPLTGTPDDFSKYVKLDQAWTAELIKEIKK
jgi:tripartite-type tricarboxylate transporter receptor subunit TctC